MHLSSHPHSAAGLDSVLSAVNEKGVNFITVPTLFISWLKVNPVHTLHANLSPSQLACGLTLPPPFQHHRSPPPTTPTSHWPYHPSQRSSEMGNHDNQVKLKKLDAQWKLCDNFHCNPFIGFLDFLTVSQWVLDYTYRHPKSYWYSYTTLQSNWFIRNDSTSYWRFNIRAYLKQKLF